MFYMLASVHQWTTIGEVLLPLDCFWYCLPDLPFEIQNMVVSFQMDLEHLIIREALLSPILSGIVAADAPLLCAFFMTLQWSDPGHHSEDAKWDTTSHEHLRAEGNTPIRETCELTMLDLGPHCHANHLREEANHLQAWRADLETTEADYRLRRWKLARCTPCSPLRAMVTTTARPPEV
jgi:hypothetical protein